MFFFEIEYYAGLLFLLAETITLTRAAETDGNWQKLAETGRNWQKLAETGRNWQKLAEIKNLKLKG